MSAVTNDDETSLSITQEVLRNRFALQFVSRAYDSIQVHHEQGQSGETGKVLLVWD
ncbi:hypothetical protein SAMN02745220_04510 [Desulfopila aestuarii DSM 18488]|uniref:Uncharacterized protein n=1 Tax=Desulfopila aestuarii DSM 18488 TaxID=1121416 RepID=A0A1M7YI55_9BACT|nr:hypothetical protein SAMN02745220_04510 [Desulfopila aestuarii DSM 18488]